MEAIFNKLKKQSTCITPKTPFRAIDLIGRVSPKCIIVAQDPYYTAGVATGLAFEGRGKPPASLRNIFKCLIAHNLIDEMPKTGNISAWNDRGCFLMNVALTTETGKAGVHMKYWKRAMTDQIVGMYKMHPVPVILLGKWAEGVFTHLIPKKHVLTYGHPSPANAKCKFAECPHFASIAGMDWTPTENTYYLFTDGASTRKNGSGWAFVIAKPRYMYGLSPEIIAEDCERINGRLTNNVQELSALLNAFRYMDDDDVWKTRSIIVVSDSKYVIGGIFEKNQAKCNKELINSILWHKAQYRRIYARHIYSHTKAPDKELLPHEAFLHWGNDRVDYLAK